MIALLYELIYIFPERSVLRAIFLKEKKLFSFISLNWAGEPLISYDKELSLIRSTKIEKKLKVDAQIIGKKYHKGLKVSDEQLNFLNIEYPKVCPKGN